VVVVQVETLAEAAVAEEQDFQMGQHREVIVLDHLLWVHQLYQYQHKVILLQLVVEELHLQVQVNVVLILLTQVLMVILQFFQQ
jgi:hypothetical protein